MQFRSDGTRTPRILRDRRPNQLNYAPHTVIVRFPLVPSDIVSFPPVPCVRAVTGQQRDVTD